MVIYNVLQVNSCIFIPPLSYEEKENTTGKEAREQSEAGCEIEKACRSRDQERRTDLQRRESSRRHRSVAHAASGPYLSRLREQAQGVRYDPQQNARSGEPQRAEPEKESMAGPPIGIAAIYKQPVNLASKKAHPLR